MSTPAQRICQNCKKPKPSSDFTPSQWKKAPGTGKCKDCQRETESVSSNSSHLSMNPKGNSSRTPNQTSFIPPQPPPIWSYPRVPVNGFVPPQPQMQISVQQEIPPHMLIPQHDFANLTAELNSLRKENELLRREKAEIMSKVIEVGLPANVISELKDAEAKIDELQTELKKSRAEITTLQEQNNELRQENDLLREEISALRSELARLHEKITKQDERIKIQEEKIKLQDERQEKYEKGYNRESKIALRALLTDAKKMIENNQCTFSEKEMDLIRSKNYKNILNAAAHRVDPFRILAAIEETKARAARECLLSIFAKIYPDFTDEDDDDIDFNELDDGK